MKKKIILDKRSKYLRKLIVDCLIGGGRGHMGSAMSLVEILRVLYDDIVKFNNKDPLNENRDRVILSKGHGCLALYSILADKKFFDKKILKTSSKFGSILGGHPETKVPGVEASTGALGHGLPIGVGMALAGKLKKKKFGVYVILGDGEINEGSIWESAMIASKHKLDNLKVILDYNKIQSYGPTKEVLDLEPLKKKWESFGFKVKEVDGHNVKTIKKSLKEMVKIKKYPSILICHTVKGKGFSFAENNPFWHHKNNFTPEEIIQINNSLK
tara:strand:+ start:559 stop:1371 length:813 start_codon:yes stop_codon:yes gene_type:complete